jgi:hypothetical protein
VLKEPGLDEFFGPTNFVLKKIYLQRLHDPFLKDEYKARMDTISSCRTRFVELEIIHTNCVDKISEETVEVELDMFSEEYNLHVDLVSQKKDIR